jgi:hypothetical protein
LPGIFATLASDGKVCEGGTMGIFDMFNPKNGKQAATQSPAVASAADEKFPNASAIAARAQTQGYLSSGVAATIDGIAVIWMDLKVDGKITLFLMLASDGLVNRLGTGAVNNTENDMFIGKTNEPLFLQLRSRIDPRWLPQMGAGYALPERKGRACELTVGFKFRDSTETGVTFSYGSESQGPPGDIVQFVIDAVGLTTPWYEREKNRVAQTR